MPLNKRETGNRSEGQRQRRARERKERFERTQEVICKSGLRGWQSKLRDNYGGSKRSFKTWDEMYNIHRRLGYKSAEEAWRENPTIQGSVKPDDLCRLDARGRRVKIPQIGEKDDLCGF